MQESKAHKHARLCTAIHAPGQWEVSQADGSLPLRLTAGPFGVLGGEEPANRKSPSEEDREPRRHSGPRRPALGAAVDESPAADEAQRPRSWPASPVTSEATRSRGLAVLSPGGPEPSGSSDSPRASAPASGARRTGRLPGPRKTPLLRDGRLTPCRPGSQKPPAQTPLPVAERK